MTQKYNPIIENLILITEIYAEVMTNGRNEELRNQIDEWKQQQDIPFTAMNQMLLDWANEFEDRFGEDRTDDYLGAIDGFTMGKLRSLRPEPIPELEFKVGDVVTISLQSLWENMPEDKKIEAYDDGGWYTKYGMNVEIEEDELTEEEKSRYIMNKKLYFDLKDEDFNDGERAIITHIGGSNDRYTLLALEGERDWKKEMALSRKEMQIAALKSEDWGSLQKGEKKMENEIKVLNAIRKLEDEIKENLTVAYKDACACRNMQYTVYLEDDMESVNILEDVAGGTAWFEETWALWKFCFKGMEFDEESGDEGFDPDGCYREIVEEWEKRCK